MQNNALDSFQVPSCASSRSQSRLQLGSWSSATLSAVKCFSREAVKNSKWNAIVTLCRILQYTDFLACESFHLSMILARLADRNPTLTRTAHLDQGYRNAKRVVQILAIEHLWLCSDNKLAGPYWGRKLSHYCLRYHADQLAFGNILNRTIATAERRGILVG
jgi:hypothetical protein